MTENKVKHLTNEELEGLREKHPEFASLATEVIALRKAFLGACTVIEEHSIAGNVLFTRMLYDKLEKVVDDLSDGYEQR